MKPCCSGSTLLVRKQIEGQPVRAKIVQTVMFAATALTRGVGEEKPLVIAAFRDSALFSAREKSALAYAEAVTHTDRHPSVEEWASLHQHFSDDALIELTALIAFQNLSRKFNAALEVPPQGFCAMAPALTLHAETK